MLTVVAPAAIAASTTWQRNATSVRVASSGENSTSAHKRLRVPNRFPRLLQALLARDAQLVFQMNVGGCEKNMDARARRSLQRLPGAVNVAGTGTSQCRR